MKLNFFYFFAIIIIASLNISCNNNDDKNNECEEYDVGYVTYVNSPTTGTVNETINLEVSFGVFNGCGVFEKFIEIENRNIRTIEVEAKYESCVCTQDAVIRTVNYEFITQISGNYELRFKSNETDYITVNLLIE